MDEFHDAKKLWQDQPMEAIPMSLPLLRRRAQEFQTKNRLAALAWMAIGLVLSFVFGASVGRTHDLLSRIGLGVLSLWALYGVYQVYRRMWPASLAADAAWGTSLDFYRRELERRRDYVRDIWRLSVLWLFFIGLALLILPTVIATRANPRLLLNGVPFFVLLVVWFIAFFFIRKRDQRNLQAEIDELRALARESQS
jgi:FtsH-binding integral membrane protein